MSEKDKHIVSEELLFRYFLHEVEADEQERVSEWKGLSEENRVEFERVKLFLLDTKALNNIANDGRTYDVDQAWKKLYRPSRLNESKGFGRLFAIIRVAAVLVLMVGIGWFIERQADPKETFAWVSNNDIKKVDLTDGSKVTLNQNSELGYTNEFGDHERRVTLQGEAYFEVRRMPDQPFIVETGEAEVRVLGTSFSVNHSNSDSLIVTVDAGRVRMGVADQEEILTPGFTGIYYKRTQQLIKIETDKVGMHNYWRMKALSFTRTPLVEVLAAIRTVYGSNVKLSNKDIVNCRVSVDLENQSIENVLNTIGEKLNLVWSKKKGYYLLAGRGCS